MVKAKLIAIFPEGNYLNVESLGINRIITKQLNNLKKLDLP